MIELRPQCKHIKVTFTRGVLVCCRPEGHKYEHVDADTGETWA